MIPARRPHTHLLGVPLVGGVLLGALLAAASLPAPSFAAESLCGDGVIVVVDFTELDGGVNTGCAPGDPSTGRAALEAAGFTVTEAQPGFICAIDSRPDPCPTTFEGSYWSYWHATPAGQWESYQVGADSSDPAPGDLEGWRYNDGSAAPGLAPADAPATVLTVPSAATPQTEGVVVPAAADTVVLVIAGGVAIGAALVVVLLFVMRSRRSNVPGVD